MFDEAVEKLLRRDRAIVLGGLVLITALAWSYLVALALRMDATGGMASMSMIEPWSMLDAGLMFAMWAIMMVAMMVPSATPMILLYARALRANAKDDTPMVPTGTFLAGYVTVWIGFSAAATAAQWGLEQAALLSPMMVATSPLFAGLVLIAAAVYQWTPIKDTCLRHCRSPVWFLSAHWRHGVGGAYTMGLEHGAYCLGCCWLLMAILFVGGVMNLLCIAAITIFVMLEKIAPAGRVVGRIAACVLALAGVGLILSVWT